MVTPEASTVVDVDLVGQWRYDVVQQLEDLGAAALLVEQLTDTFQRRLGILTPARREALDEQYRKERKSRLEAVLAGLPSDIGATPTPGNFAGIAMAAEIWAVLQHHIRRCSKQLDAQRVCAIHQLRIRDDATTGVTDLVRLLSHQVMAVTSSSLLASIGDDLGELLGRVTNFVDAVEESSHLDAPCPHCGRRSLVVQFHLGTIRCDRDPRSHHYEACICSDPLCACKHRPIGHRHTWHRTGQQPSWYALRDRLNLANQATPPGDPE